MSTKCEASHCCDKATDMRYEDGGLRHYCELHAPSHTKGEFAGCDDSADKTTDRSTCPGTSADVAYGRSRNEGTGMPWLIKDNSSFDATGKSKAMGPRIDRA